MARISRKLYCGGGGWCDMQCAGRTNPIIVETHGRASLHIVRPYNHAMRLYETKCIIGGHYRYPIWRDFHQYNPQLTDIHFHYG